MNQINTPLDLSTATRRAPDRGLSDADLARLSKALTSGENPLATRADLKALHKRIVEMMTTLGEGLSAQQGTKAAEDRQALVARLDRMEKSVNTMEGALRIEIAPMMQEMITTALDQRLPKRAHPRRRVLPAVLLMGAGLGLGILFAEELRGFGAAIIAWAQALGGN